MCASGLLFAFFKGWLLAVIIIGVLPVLFLVILILNK